MKIAPREMVHDTFSERKGENHQGHLPTGPLAKNSHVQFSGIQGLLCLAVGSREPSTNFITAARHQSSVSTLCLPLFHCRLLID